MLILKNLRFTKSQTDEDLRRAAAAVLKIPDAAVISVKIQRRSIDARRKPDVLFVYTLLVSAADEDKIKKSADVSRYIPPEEYAFPAFCGIDNNPPIIVGTGPAGLFAALCLAESGARCIILERGQPVEKRVRDVENFWNTGTLDASSNVQFGEGGAGTFSDGKLTTGVNDIRIRFVLESFVRFGAPEEILYSSKPHIGTDRLRAVVQAIRRRLIELGCDIRFGHKLTDIETGNGRLINVTVDCAGERYKIAAAGGLILAPGNSSRDTFEMLYRRGVTLAAKNFSVGLRIEHRQRDIDTAQYGALPYPGAYPPSDYKLAYHADGENSVYTFCVCPGGAVVASSSQPGGVVTNGMSEYARDGENCNGAVLVSVDGARFSNNPLAAIEYQRSLERAAFMAGGGTYRAPAQLLGDFLSKIPSSRAGTVKPTYRPGVKFLNLWDVLPEDICAPIAAALPEFDKRVRGFAQPDAVLTAAETRSSSPVRILREDYEAAGVRGLFPCGEGAGYAGGIMSAAVDGIKCAEALAGRGGRASGGKLFREKV